MLARLKKRIFKSKRNSSPCPRESSHRSPSSLPTPPIIQWTNPNQTFSTSVNVLKKSGPVSYSLSISGFTMTLEPKATREVTNDQLLVMLSYPSQRPALKTSAFGTLDSFTPSSVEQNLFKSGDALGLRPPKQPNKLETFNSNIERTFDNRSFDISALSTIPIRRANTSMGKEEKHLSFQFRLSQISSVQVNHQTVRITSYDFRIIRIEFSNMNDLTCALDLIKATEPLLYPKGHLTFLPSQTLFSYVPALELQRLGFDVMTDTSSLWQVKKYEDSFVIIPKFINDDVLLSMNQNFYQGSLLYWSWATRNKSHPCCKGALLRSSRPMCFVGSYNSQLFQREQAEQSNILFTLMEEIYNITFAEASLNGKPTLNTLIFDTGKSNSQFVSFLPFAEVSFLDFPTSEVLTAFNELQVSLQDIDFRKLANHMNSSPWYRLVMKANTFATQIVESMKTERWCVVVSGGPNYRDIDSLIVCLVQVMLDPEYRTVAGFCRMLRKDWFLEGIRYKVSEEVFTGARLKHDSIRKLPSFHVSAQKGCQNYVPFPIFFLLVSCVVDLLNQHQHSFQFNKTFLIDLLNLVLEHQAFPIPYDNCHSDDSFCESLELSLQDGSLPRWISEKEWTQRCRFQIQAIHQCFSAFDTKNTSFPSEFRNPFYNSTSSQVIVHNANVPLDFFFEYILAYNEANKAEEMAFLKTTEETKSPELMIDTAVPFMTPELITALLPLTSLRISKGVISSLPDQFSRLENLSKLYLMSNRFHSMPPVLTFLSLTVLNLAHNQISVIPNWIASLKDLHTLVLDQNLITNLGNICFLPNLTILSLNENLISYLDPAISRLSKLERLNLDFNKIRALPSGFVSSPNQLSTLIIPRNSLSVLPLHWSGVANLTLLNLHNNQLSHLPMGLGDCYSLKVLILSKNRFSKWPSVLTSFPKLEELDVTDNQFRDMPYWISQMKRIKTLSLGGNQLESISHAISQLSTLQRLDLRDNGITEIPSTLALLGKTLQSLLITGNPLQPVFLEPGITTEQIRKILQKQMDLELHLNEGMIMTFGPPLSGKTSLVKKVIASPQFTLAPIDIPDLSNRLTVRHLEYKFTANSGLTTSTSTTKTKKSSLKKSIDARKNSMTGEVEPPQDVKFSLWDFKTKDILEGVYSTFLRNGLVLLTIDIRDPQIIQNLKYWFLVINAASTSPKVLVVFTFVDIWLRTNRDPEVYMNSTVNKLKSLWSKFEFMEMCLYYPDNPELFTNLLNKLTTYLEQDETIKRSVPIKFIQLRVLLQKVAGSRLERQETPILSQNEFVVYGNACGMVGMNEILRCARLLHNSGCIVYFQNDPALKDSVILRPDWLADIFSLLFDNPQVDCENGTLDHQSYFKFLEKYPTWRRLITQNLLERFEFAEPLLASEQPTDGPQIFVYPLLTPNVPFTTRNRKNFFVERIVRFPFLPLKFFHIFMTRLLQLISPIKKSSMIWTNGMFATVEESNAVLNIDIRCDLCRPEGKPDSDPEAILSIQDEMVIRVDGASKHEVRKLITIILEIFAMLIEPTNIDSTPYFRTTGLVPLESIEHHIQDNRTKIHQDGIPLDLFDIVPDLLIYSYSGPRHSLKDLTIGRVLGEGTYSIVKTTTLAEKEVAIKMLHDNEQGQKAKSHSAFSLFRQEVHVQADLNHPSIVQILGIVLRPFCVITEYCPYGDLFDLLHVQKALPLSWSWRLKVSLDIASGLQYMQERSPPVAHLDLKTPNVLLASMDHKNLCAKIADFGTSQQVFGPITVRKVDNPVWQAPEVLMGFPYNESADTYAAGVIYWEIITRQQYFGQVEFVSDISQMVVAGNRPQIPSDCHATYEEIIRSCWHQIPELRPTMAKVVQKLYSIIMPAAPSPPTVRPMFKVPKGRQRKRQNSPSPPD